MTPTFRRLFAVPSFVLLIACGNQRPAQSADGQNAGGPDDPGRGGAAPNLTPVPAPPDLIAKGRLQDPGAAIDTFMEWAKVPIDWRRLAQQNEPELASLVAFDAPVEFAVALDPQAQAGGDLPQPFAVVSIGLSSVEGAAQFVRRQGRDVKRSGGAYRVTSEGMSCAIAPSVGKSRARLVCGDRDADVDALLGYATRGLPNESMGNANFHAELWAEPIRRRYGKQLRQLKSALLPYALKEYSLDNAHFDRALGEAFHGLADELLLIVDDIDRITIDGQLRKDQGVMDATGSVKFKSQSSWLTGVFVDVAKRSKGVPDEFWTLPEDSQSANFGTTGDPKRYEKIRRTLAELADGLLQHEKVPKAVRDQLHELIIGLFTMDGSYTYAHGSVPANPQAGPFDTRETVRQQIGWYVGALTEKPAKYKAYFDKMAKLYNDPQLRLVLEKKAGIKLKDIPRLTVRGTRATGLPAGTTVYEVSISGALLDGNMPPVAMPPGKKIGPAKSAALPVLLVLVPDGDRTWFGVSTDEKILSTKLAGALKKQNTLENRKDLRALKSGKSINGGFMTLMAVLGSYLQAAATMTGPGAMGRAQAAMPNKGQNAMVFTSSIDAGPTISWKMSIPSGVFEDIGGAAMAMKGAFGGPPPSPPPPAPVPRKRP